MKATKKPLTIECFQFDGDLKTNKGEYYVPRWAVEAFEQGILHFESMHVNEPPCELFIKSGDDEVHVEVGDYIVLETDGKLYPCKPDIFDKTYDIVRDDTKIETDDSFTHSFSWALEMMKKGHKIHRSGWNGKGMFAVLQKGYPQGIPCNKQTAEAWGIKEGDLFRCEPYMQLKMVNGSHSMWVPSVNDCLSNDWAIVVTDISGTEPA